MSARKITGAIIEKSVDDVTGGSIPPTPHALPSSCILGKSKSTKKVHAEILVLLGLLDLRDVKARVGGQAS